MPGTVDWPGNEECLETDRGDDRLDRGARAVAARRRPPPATSGPSGRRRPGPPTTRTPTATPTASPRPPSPPPARPISASTGSPRDATPPTSPTSTASPTATASPTSSSRSQEVAEHVYEVENEKLGWRDPRSDGREGGAHGKTDVYLAQIGGSLFGYAAPDRGQAGRRRPPAAPPARLPRPRQRLRPLRVPGDEVARGPRGHLRPRVQPHPPVRLRRLPGRLVRRVDGDLDGGPGLQRHQRLPALRAALDPPLRHADHGDLDPRVRLRRLEPVADPPLRPLDHPQGLGRRGPRQARRLLGRRLRPRDPRRRALRLRPRLRPLLPRRRRVAHRRRSSARATSTSTSPARAGSRPARAPKIRTLNHTTFQLLRVDARGGRAVAVEVSAPAGAAAGVALVGRIGSEEQGQVVSRITFKRNGGRLSVQPRAPRPLRPDHGRPDQRRHDAPSASARGASTGTT